MGCLEAGSYADHEGGILGDMTVVGCHMLRVGCVYMKVCRNLCPDAINSAAISVARKSVQSIAPPLSYINRLESSLVVTRCVNLVFDALTYTR